MGYEVEVVFPLGHNVQHTNKDGTPASPSPTPNITFFTSSHSGRVLAVGGCGILKFFALQQVGQQVALKLVEDCAETFKDIREGYMFSCLGLPPFSQSVVDWMVIGDANGKIYGF